MVYAVQRPARTVLAVIKRLNKCAKARIPEKEELEWVKRAYELWQAENRILKNTPLSQEFTAFGGGINEKKREAFLKPLYELHQLCAQVFMDYNADAFNSVCNHIMGGYAKPLINGVIDIMEGHILIGCSRLINALLLIVCIAVGLSATLLMVKDSLL